MRGEHRVALARHEGVDAAHVGAVDVELALVGDRFGLLVGALAQADARAGGGEGLAVVLGAPQVGLEDGAGAGELLAQARDDLQGGVGDRVVLHVDGDGGPGLGGGLADLAGQAVGELGVDALADRRELDADLGGLGQALGVEGGEQVAVLVSGGVRLLDDDGVLAEVVEGGEQSVRGEGPGGGHRVGGGLPRHVSADERPGDRRGSYEALDLR